MKNVKNYHFIYGVIPLTELFIRHDIIADIKKPALNEQRRLFVLKLQFVG